MGMGFEYWPSNSAFFYFSFFFPMENIAISETKLLTITGKKYFSTVLVVRTSAQDPNGLK